MEQFINYLHTEKLVKNGKASIIDACTLIVRFLTPAKDFMSLRAHVLALKNGKKTDNPINYYFKHKVAPPTTHYVLPSYQSIPVNKQNKEILNEPWKSFIYPEPKRNSIDVSCISSIILQFYFFKIIFEEFSRKTMVVTFVTL